MATESSKNNEYLCKMLIIGDSGVGKTNILLRLCNYDFQKDHLITLGFIIIKEQIIKLKHLNYKINF